MTSSLPFSHNLDGPANSESQREVVVDLRWSWSSVIESDELVGSINAVSRLPQYLMALSACTS